MSSKISVRPLAASTSARSRSDLGHILLYPSVEHPIPLPGHATLECGICFDNFHPTSNPFMSSNSAASSNQVPYGLRLSKCGHGYCLADLTTYLKNKLNGGGEGLTVVFPIGCPSVRRTIALPFPSPSAPDQSTLALFCAVWQWRRCVRR